MQRIFSLKGQMLLNNIFIFILPTLIIGYITISISNHQVQESVKQSNNIMLLNVNNQVENFIKSPINIINGLEKELLLKDNISDEKINKYLDEIIKIYPYFNNIQIISKDGFVKNTALSNKEKIGTNATNEDFFKKIDKSGKLVWSSVFISDQIQKPTVSISLYVNGNLLVVDLNLSTIIKISQDTTSGSVQNISILDGKGIYLIDNNYDNVNQRRQFAYFNEIKNETKNQETNISDKNNNKLILYSMKNKHTGWYSVITLNSNKVFEPIIKIKNTFYISFAIMLLLYFILSELSIVNITRDFNNLINKTKLISAGDYSIYPKVRGYSEFVELYKYFDIMKEHVQLRENDILSLNLELEDKVVKRTKQLEDKINDKLKQANSDLKKEILERIAIEEQLTKSKLEAEQANIAKSQFLANMSHEIRTPINGIMGMTQLALMTDLDEEAREYLTLVMKSTKVLLAIINNVLDFSKIEAGKIIIESKPFKIKDVINEVTTLFDISANEKGIVLSAEIDKDIPIILNGDAIKLRQILSNIIGNAVKFTEMGKVIVGLSMDYIDENTVKVKFSIKDTGIGISKDKQGLLFERFEQLDSTYTKQYQGSGLGLAISKNLVELMGGDIWLESEERIGSTFYFTTNLQKETGVCISKVIVVNGGPGGII
ncbi:hypothetical protein LGL55_15075 [Clostridium tagluense]|uniref:hybrid sensor histidine kinase/response regulator n=1 Tax=Clostridium tagluense TaxID=360422 RepID=UPI001CF340F9|nr:hybrid sensor histidine kinase/response regulator [Clostridium tagluense]MCB2312605.1 hypothetical protein [Clostridium tagluense]MCB2317281.1 hypothetical protein [Clostridium tagluense]MCB2322148.1 hypothetical protein [Clostridium tagluense]MCB2327077.1 hypothetical protein [Clostridium tagluense]MCB2331795.1 hypothetical protein [Clostridium tagluense]